MLLASAEFDPCEHLQMAFHCPIIRCCLIPLQIRLVFHSIWTTNESFALFILINSFVYLKFRNVRSMIESSQKKKKNSLVILLMNSLWFYGKFNLSLCQNLMYCSYSFQTIVFYVCFKKTYRSYSYLKTMLLFRQSDIYHLVGLFYVLSPLVAFNSSSQYTNWYHMSWFGYTLNSS